MVARIVLDVVRRKWKGIAFAVFQIYLVRKIAWEFWPSSDPLAWLFAGAAFLMVGPGAMLEQRELSQLPVSRRTWWLARWWLSTAGVVVVAQAGMSWAEWSAETRWPGGEWLVVSTGMAVLYCGCVMALVGTRWGRGADKPLMIESAPNQAVPRPPIQPVLIWWVVLRAFGRVLVPTFAVLLAPLVVPFFIAPYLPHAFSEIGGLPAVVMLAMAACAAWGFLHQPPIEAKPNQRVATAGAHRPAPANVPAGPSVEARERFVDRLTGLRLPLWRAGRKYLIAYSFVITAGIAWWWVTSLFKTVPTLADVLSRVDMLPLASPTARMTEPITVGIMLLAAGLLDVGLVANLRPLRALPLSATQLSGLPVGVGLLSAAMLWIVFLVLHALVLRTPPVSFRIDLFTAFAALSTLAQVLRVVLPGEPSTRTAIAAMGPLGLTWGAVGYAVDSAATFRADLVQPAMFFGGLLVLAGSFALMYRAITRSNRVYRARPMGAPGV